MRTGSFDRESKHNTWPRLFLLTEEDYKRGSHQKKERLEKAKCDTNG